MSPNNEPRIPANSEGGTSINQVRCIPRDRAMWITTRGEVSEYVEAPLLEACLILWDKNIRTLSSSANSQDLEQGYAYITVDYESLSEANKLIAQKLGEVEDGYTTLAVKIKYPLSDQTSQSELSAQAVETAQNFKKQIPRWIPSFTIEELKERSMIPPDNREADNPEYWMPAGFFYDPDSKKFFLSEEHFNKMLENIEE